MQQDITILSKDLESLVDSGDKETIKKNIPRILAEHFFGIKSFSITDVGKKRKENEDSILEEPTKCLFAVADGMGGHYGGGIASKTVINILREAYNPNNPQSLKNAVLAAHEIIKDKNIGKKGSERMGTTLTAVAVEDYIMYTAHVGDSSIYLIRGNEIKKLSREDTQIGLVLQEQNVSRKEAFDIAVSKKAKKLMGKTKGLTEEAALVEARNKIPGMIAKTVGMEEEFDVETKSNELRDGDYILICSDGLTKMLEKEDLTIDEQKIKSTIADKGYSVEEAAKKLVDIANEAGGSDNISVVLIKKERGRYEQIGEEELETAAMNGLTFSDADLNEIIGIKPEHKKGKKGLVERLKGYVAPLAAAFTFGIGFWLGSTYQSWNRSYLVQIQQPAQQVETLKPKKGGFEAIKESENALVELPRRRDLKTKDILYPIKSVLFVTKEGERVSTFGIPVRAEDGSKVYGFFENNLNPGKAYVSSVENGEARFNIEAPETAGRFNVIVINKNDVQTASWVYKLKDSETEKLEKEVKGVEEGVKRLEDKIKDVDKELRELEKKIEDNNKIEDTDDEDKGLTYLGIGKDKLKRDIKKLVRYKNEHPNSSISTIAKYSGIAWIDSETTAYKALRYAMQNGKRINRFDINLASKEMMHEVLYADAPLNKLAKKLTKQYNIHISASTISNYRSKYT